jgi:hypothetical protein
MIDPNDARARLHAMIDEIPDEQIALIWMTFQSMFEGDLEDEEADDADFGDIDEE